MGARSVADSGAPGGVPRPAWLWVVRLGALVALGASLHLLIASLRGGTIAGCGGPGSGCERVLSTRWAFWLGVPVSALGAVLHAGVLGLSWRLPRAWTGLRALGLTAVAAAVWFVAVQWVSVGAFCRFCMLAHGGALLVLVGAWRAGGSATPGAWTRPAWLAAGGLCVLAAGQALSDPPTRTRSVPRPCRASARRTGHAATGGSRATSTANCASPSIRFRCSATATRST